MIKIINIDKTYGEGLNAVHALKNINLIIPDGKLTAIIGKSGSGKSTLLNLMGCLDKPTFGQIIVNEVDITNLNDKEFSFYRNKNIGFIFQDFYLESSLSVIDNIVMPLIII